MFPGIHIGRAWFAYYMLPLPEPDGHVAELRSPLIWDVFAVSTYFTVSLLFWYIGLIPDLATLRDRAKTQVRKIVYGVFALGWRGSQPPLAQLRARVPDPRRRSRRRWCSRCTRSCRFDFATVVMPGWHTTIFPPYFVAGAVFSGFAMVHDADDHRPRRSSASKTSSR